jgi:hypothetical protein
MQTLQNPYLVQKLANVTGANLEPDNEPADDPQVPMLQDNLFTQDVEVLAELTLGINTTTTLLEALHNMG